MVEETSEYVLANQQIKPVGTGTAGPVDTTSCGQAI
jgi:hypothetical protein